MITLDNFTRTGAQGRSILEALNNARVLNVSATEDGYFLLEEACDYAFSVKFTRAQLIELADELLALAKDLSQEQ